jgi:prolyl-tRNA synthetase
MSGDKLKSQSLAREAFIANAPALLAEIQAGLFAEAKARLTTNIKDGAASMADIETFFGAAEDEDKGFKGWLKVGWAKPSGADLEKVSDRLKALKLTLRNAPLEQGAISGACVFTGAPVVQNVLVARAY